MDLRRGRVRLRVPERLNLKNRLLGQCQTKSFLGNLVCFKTCTSTSNHDLRNSRKKSPQIAPTSPKHEQ